MKPSLVRDHLTLYWQTYVACLGFFVIILIFGSFQLRRLGLEKEHHSWPQTMATIRSVKYAERADYRKNGTTVIADIYLDVTYTADGIVCQGEIIQSFQGPFSVTSQKGFSAGQKVPIRFNPKDPSEIYLDTSKQF